MSLNFVNADGQKIFTRSWAAEGTERGVILIAHGIGEHSKFYEHVGQALAKAGYHGYALDHRGHGQSEGKRVQVKTHTDFVRDLKQFYDAVCQRHPDTRPFLLGHSMGSLISLQFALTHPDALRALVVTGTAIDMKSTASPLLVAFGNFMAQVIPASPISPPLTDPSILTNDPEMQRRRLEDPLVNKGWTPANIAKFIVDTGEMIKVRANELQLPLLIMHGEADPLTPISGSNILYERAGSTDKTLFTYPGMKHEILNEIEREKVIQQIIQWLNEH